VAIKHIDRVFEVREDALRIVRELRFLRLLKHANVRSRLERLLGRFPRALAHALNVHVLWATVGISLNVEPTGCAGGRGGGCAAAAE
jgi:hypothetical protein